MDEFDKMLDQSLSEDSDNERDEQAELLGRAKELFIKAFGGWSDIHNKAIDDLKFFNNEQWDDDLLTLARAKREPVVTVNMLPQFVKQIENELRQRELAINYHATDEVGSDDTANILTGLVRSIEQKSHARSHYIHAAGENGAMVPGFGFLKVELDYETPDPENFNQEPCIKSVKDPFKVVCDPAFQEPDASDANYWFEWEDYPIDVFKMNWPGAAPDNWAVNDGFFGTGETVRVCRFYWKEEQVTTSFLVANEDGSPAGIVAEQAIDSIVDSDDEPGRRYAVLKDGTRNILLRRRHVNQCTIKWADFTGTEVLDQGDWVGSKFPYVLVSGVMTQYNGTKDIRGMIRFAKDSQKMLNYMASSAARRIGSANKSPWIVDMSSIAAYKKVWDKANINNAPYLPYNAYSADQANRQNPAPVRADQTGQIQDLLAASQKFENDLKRTVGIYDAGLGATPNEQSGVAIKTLAQQGQNANFHFSDNLVRSLQRLGEILIDLIPRIYDTPRVVRIVGADTKAKVVKINQLFSENGKAKKYDLTAGSYGVTVNVGPAYATARQAAIEQLLELARTNPNVVPYIQDIIARNMDFDGKDELTDRLVKLLAATAPQLVDGTPQADMPPQALAAMTQMKATIDQLTQQLMATTGDLEKLAQEKQAKVWDHQAAMELQRQKTADALILNEKQAKTAAEQEALRAERDALNDQANVELAQIKARLSHTEEMLKIVANLVKSVGPQALGLLEQLPPPNELPPQQ